MSLSDDTFNFHNMRLDVKPIDVCPHP